MTGKICQGEFEAKPHHTKREFGNHCRSAASVVMDGKNLCRKCAQTARRLELRKKFVRELLISKWPKHSRSVLEPGELISPASIDELVEALLPHLKPGRYHGDEKEDGPRS